MNKQGLCQKPAGKRPPIEEKEEHEKGTPE
jgi:hypothetical protein